MKPVNKALFVTIVIALFLGQMVHAQEKTGLKWYTDLNEVCALSKKTKKPVFAFFTGSDWCVWCHRMEANVFAKPAFQAWAKKNVILLELDFPRGKKLPDALVNQNNQLQQLFKVEGFPTVWIFDVEKDATNKMNLSPIGTLGYPQAEPGKEEVAFLATANSIVKPKAQMK